MEREGDNDEEGEERGKEAHVPWEREREVRPSELTILTVRARLLSVVHARRTSLMRRKGKFLANSKNSSLPGALSASLPERELLFVKNDWKSGKSWSVSGRPNKYFICLG